MTELQTLTAQKDELLSKIREIESMCIGTENENSTGTTDLNEAGINRILDAIKNQRFYFFKNKKMIFFDRDTGRIWANQCYYYKSFDSDISSDNYYRKELNTLNLDGFNEWELPTLGVINELKDSVQYLHLKDDEYWVRYIAANVSFFRALATAMGHHYSSIGEESSHSCDSGKHILLPYSNTLVKDTTYVEDISDDNPIYSEKERLQFTLDLFVKNELLPVFDNDEISKLYKGIYFDKPSLSERLQELKSQMQEIESQIQKLQTATLLSSDFDYTSLLSKYDIKSIDNSVIKYYQAIQQWSYELMDKLDYYEQQTSSLLRDFNVIGLKLSKKYEDNPNLTAEENTLLSERQCFFQKNFSLGMHSVKSKILSVKKQADDLESRIDEIDNGDDAIHELALLEKEERTSFGFIAENTAKIIKNALLKIEYFQDNHRFVMNAVDIWEKWSENYRVFKTTYYEDLKADCEDDGIEENIWSKWYQDWQNIRFAIEQKVQPVIERGLKSEMPTITETKVSVPELLIDALDKYKNSIDKFFTEDRKGIYQKFAFQPGGELQDKFETESELYKRTSSLQSALQEIIFNCAKAEDRVFILKWANNLLDIQIDEILSFVANNDLKKISQTILTDFAALKQKNFDTYLADIKAYGEEKSRREKEYNSLIFKMRKDLMKK